MTGIVEDSKEDRLKNNGFQNGNDASKNVREKRLLSKSIYWPGHASNPVTFGIKKMSRRVSEGDGQKETPHSSLFPALPQTCRFNSGYENVATKVQRLGQVMEESERKSLHLRRARRGKAKNTSECCSPSGTRKKDENVLAQTSCRTEGNFHKKQVDYTKSKIKKKLTEKQVVKLLLISNSNKNCSSTK